MLATGTSDTSGHFRFSFDLGSGPDAHALKLLGSGANFASGSRDVIVSSGSPDLPFYSLGLLPQDVAACLLDSPFLVIIGHFRSSSSDTPFTDFSERIADALTYNLNYDLLLPLQEVKILRDFQPVFYRCDEATPRTKQLAGTYARALKAHAFISGDVQHQQGQFRVSTYVGDAYDLFVPPLRTVNEGVDLSDPGAAKLDPNTHAAILLALAAGYEQSGRFAECVDVAVAADQLDPGISTLLRQTIQRQLASCQEKLPNRGLARRAHP